MSREYTHIICPNRCGIGAQIREKEDETRRICSVGGAAYPKGRVYVEQEVMTLHRNIAISVLAEGGILPLVSMKLTNPIPRGRILDATDEAKEYTPTASVRTGTVVIPHLLGYDADVIVTKSVSENGCR